MANPVTTTPTPTTTEATTLPVNWAIGFLKSIGAPTTQNNIDNVLRWGNAESGGSQAYGGWSNFNPLNVVTQQGDNSTGAGGAQGDIANFGDITSGVAASARLFQGNPNASGIIQTLRANGSTDQLNSAVNGFYATWGGSINLAGASPTPQNVQTTGKGIGGLIGEAILSPAAATLNVLGIKTPLDSIGAVSQFLFGDWRYVTEVVVGAAMVLLGIFLIARDTGAYGRAKHDAESAAVIGAAA